MEVLRHDDVAGHNEIVFAPDFFKTLEEEISSSRRFQELSAAIATACNEMKFAATVESLASFRHAEQYSARVNHSHLRSTKEVPRRIDWIRAKAPTWTHVVFLVLRTKK